MDEKEIREMFGIKPERTLKQNKALHMAFTLLADELNGAGLDMKKVLKVDIPWTPKTVKEFLYRPIMKAMLHKESTTELDTKEISDVWEVLTRELAEKKGIAAIPFPSEETTINYLNSLKQTRNA